VPARPAAPCPVPLSSRDRLVAALADRPRTVAQLAQSFRLSQPTMLEQVRRALADGLIVEVDVSPEERRFAAERYYAPTVPVIRAPDAEVIESACQAISHEMARVLRDNWSELLSAFAMTHLAREGWTFDDLWLYMDETIRRLVQEQMVGVVNRAPIPDHGLTWVEEIVELDAAREEQYA
jgi:DNA-binding Lrp family transcriptional regulator